MHGGSSTGAPKGNTNATKHGFYSDALQPDERALWERVEVGGLDDEIRLMRVKLHRLVRLSGSADVAELVDSALEVAKKRGEDMRGMPFDRTEIKVAAPRYAELIFQALDQIRKLELARAQLAEAARKASAEDDGGAQEPVGEIRLRIVRPGDVVREDGDDGQGS
jgi:hypothetical protein